MIRGERHLAARRAAADLTCRALLDVRGSATRRQLLTGECPATDTGDFVAHIQAVAAIVVDLPWWGVRPWRRHVPPHDLASWLALLASDEGPRGAWVRAVFADIGYVTVVPTASPSKDSVRALD